MREILFRGKCADNKAWVEGDLSRCVVAGEIHICRIEDNLSTTTHRIDPETVCQYTGLTDKNGWKIFEGDICQDGDNIVRILWNDKHQWGVEISKTDNVLSRGLIFPLWQYDNCKENGYRTLKVIGNIFDTPKLVNGNNTIKAEV